MIRKLITKIQNSALVAHISFLWHWKNFFFVMRYPFWKARNVFTGKFLGYSFTWYDDIPEGWKKAFGKQLSKDIKNAFKKDKKLNPKLTWKQALYWEQIKEKYGSLCLYASATGNIQTVLDKYELLSHAYCIHCGNPARYKTPFYIEYLCENCMRKELNAQFKDEECLYDDYIVDHLKNNRLTREDIPKIIIYDNDEKTELNLKVVYGIDFEQLWGLNQ